MNRYSGFSGQYFLILTFLLTFHFGEKGLQLQADEPSLQPMQSQNDLRYRNRIFKTGDAVEISVFPDTSSFLHGIFPIDGEGFIYLPIKGKVKIIEMSTSEFSEYLTANFKQYIRTPDVLVRPLIRVSMLGGFNSPGMFYVQENLTLWQLVQRAGGAIHEEGLKDMRWERDRDIMNVDLISYLESGNSIKDMGIRTGDQIWTPVPDQPGLLEKVGVILPYITVGISAYTLYLTYYLISSGR
jgi:polysaccharide export outer membrane protein